MNSELDPTTDAPAPLDPSFPIVGIGASAGGLGALEAFFSSMPAVPEPGMAFVIVQHLAPDHRSMLTELIQRCTSLRVVEVTNGMAVTPNCVYIIPPNRDMALLHGTLQLLEPTLPRMRRLPIDFFFKSLAQDQHERAIGIVLSGTGSDGALGVRDVKGEGGMVMAQQPETAEYDGMPRNAMATGLVDFVLPVSEMPARLQAYAGRALGQASSSSSDEAGPVEPALATLFVTLRAQTGHDFSHYKQSTIDRRIRRRMAVHQIATMGEYVQLLRESPGEIEDLFHDLLIRVTSFFRDPDAFDVLAAELAKNVFSDKRDGDSIRAWVSGCCTGEEAYSIAILLAELAEQRAQNLRIHVFATDIDTAAIRIARTGTYPAGIAGEMTPERLERGFELESDTGRYRVRKAIREMLVFSEQDLVRDPPFSQLDLISCRNLMIYLGPSLQAQVLSVFHYALRPGGLLLLGTSESVGDRREEFIVLDPKAKLYQRKLEAPGVARAASGRLYPSMAANRAPLRTEFRRAGRPIPLRELTERALLQCFTAAAVLVNDRGDILYLHGRTGRYLEPAPGESSLNVLTMARDGLRHVLTAALREVVATRKPTRRPGLRVRTNGSQSVVDCSIRPVAGGSSFAPGTDLFLVVLEEQRPPEETADPTAAAAQVPISEDVPHTDVDRRIVDLKQELRSQAEHLELNRSELAVSNEDLKIANEELQSLNEELQSANEEMETSKEELQSLNEELATVNAQLQQRVQELSQSNNDWNDLFACTGVGTIYVDHQLRIQRFTPEATAVVNLIPSDVGRPLGQIRTNLLDYDRLIPDIHAVLETLVPREVEVSTANAWYLLRIRPYRTLKNVIGGAVVSFPDITESKRGLDGLRRLAVVVRDSRDAIVVQDLTGQILAWNPGAERLFGWSEEEALTMNIRDLVPDGLRDEVGKRMHALVEARSVQPLRAKRIAKGGRLFDVVLTAGALTDSTGSLYAVSTTEREVHD